MPTPIILTHGGAGAPNEFSDGCETACRTGLVWLTDGKKDQALRAVIEAAVVLEDDKRFNAGTGSNLRLDGGIELDASLATSDGRIGAVACLRATKNPIRVARAVMDTPHILLSGEGAIRFARSRGFLEANMVTRRALKKWHAAQERLKSGNLRPYEKRWKDFDFKGTIGAVARAKDGSFAVSCSTGGTSMMLPGRIGDTPIFGAGIMCGPAGAVCSTGSGEEIIRRLSAMRVYQAIEQGMHPQAACEREVREFPHPFPGGFIAVSRDAHGMAATNDRMARFALAAE